MGRHDARILVNLHPQETAAEQSPERRRRRNPTPSDPPARAALPLKSQGRGAPSAHPAPRGPSPLLHGLDWQLAAGARPHVGEAEVARRHVDVLAEELDVGGEAQRAQERTPLGAVGLADVDHQDAVAAAAAAVGVVVARRAARLTNSLPSWVPISCTLYMRVGWS